MWRCNLTWKTRKAELKDHEKSKRQLRMLILYVKKANFALPEENEWPQLEMTEEEGTVTFAIQWLCNNHYGLHCSATHLTKRDSDRRQSCYLHPLKTRRMELHRTLQGNIQAPYAPLLLFWDKRRQNCSSPAQHFYIPWCHPSLLLPHRDLSPGFAASRPPFSQFNYLIPLTDTDLDAHMASVCVLPLTAHMIRGHKHTTFECILKGGNREAVMEIEVHTWSFDVTGCLEFMGTFCVSLPKKNQDVVLRVKCSGKPDALFQGKEEKECQREKCKWNQRHINCHFQQHEQYVLQLLCSLWCVWALS